jgi:hypothetical protein
VCDSGLPSWIACMLKEIGSGVLLYKSIRFLYDDSVSASYS